MVAETGTAPWLSLLIPAYEYPLGVRRILDVLAASGTAGVECIVGDDSRSDEVERCVRAHPLFGSGIVRYGRGAGGAIRNWNTLLEQARGEYVLLMHHDECPEEADFFAKLAAAIATTPRPDHIILDCLLPTHAGLLRQHMPRWARRLLLRTFPTHFLRHNSVGPPSVWVARRALVQPYRTDLKWLVDVEWYVRILGARDPRVGPGPIVDMPRLAVVSLPQPTKSITASLAGQIPRLVREEAALIQRDFGRLPVFRLLLPASTAERFVAATEGAGWTGFRVVLRILGMLGARRMPSWYRRES